MTRCPCCGFDEEGEDTSRLPLFAAPMVDLDNDTLERRIEHVKDAKVYVEDYLAQLRELHYQRSRDALTLVPREGK